MQLSRCTEQPQRCAAWRRRRSRYVGCVRGRALACMHAPTGQAGSFLGMHGQGVVRRRGALAAFMGGRGGTHKLPRQKFAAASASAPPTRSPCHCSTTPRGRHHPPCVSRGDGQGPHASRGRHRPCAGACSSSPTNPAGCTHAQQGSGRANPHYARACSSSRPHPTPTCSARSQVPRDSPLHPLPPAHSSEHGGPAQGNRSSCRSCKGGALNGSSDRCGVCAGSRTCKGHQGAAGGSSRSGQQGGGASLSSS